MRLDGPVREPAVQRDLARGDAQRDKLAAGRREQVGLVGEPILKTAGTISPRAPRRVFSVISPIWKTEPNSVG